MFNLNKKGELTTTQIVMLIVLVLSFVVIVLFLSRMNLQEESKREICKASVILAAKDPVNKNVNCQTSYVCITNGEPCKDITPDRTIKIASSSSERENILKAIATELSDCWMMFGEGNVNYVSSVGGARYHCAVCSIVKFGGTLTSQTIDSDELKLFLDTELKSESQTYSSYLYRVPKVEDAGRMYPLPNLDLSKKYAVVTGINPEFDVLVDRTPKPVYPSIVSIEEVSSLGVCDVFDATTS